MRIEVQCRRAGTRQHLATRTVEAESTTDLFEALTLYRTPVESDLVARLLRARKKKELAHLRRHTDFFDKKGKDISDEEYFDNLTRVGDL